MEGKLCPVCASDDTQVFLSRSGVPVHQNLLMVDEAGARAIGRGDLEYAVCHGCGFVYNQAFDLDRLSYSGAYDNTQSCSAVFEAYTDELATGLIARSPLNIVEVGCGKGGFLRKLVEADERNTGIGFDPAYVGNDVLLDGRLRFERRFYADDARDAGADLVVCRHVIEHVPDPLALVRGVRAAVANAPHARVVFETPCVDWILRHFVIWDFFYEHCSLFSDRSLATLFELAGFRVERLHHVFGGQYLWLEATPATPADASFRTPEPTPVLALRYGAAARELEHSWRQRVTQLAERGGVAIWGAGAKGVTFANLVDPDRALIACAVDLNPAKQGKYVPGTGHPIVDFRRLPEFGVVTAILMNPNYRQENLALLTNAGLSVELA